MVRYFLAEGGDYLCDESVEERTRQSFIIFVYLTRCIDFFRFLITTCFSIFRFSNLQSQQTFDHYTSDQVSISLIHQLHASKPRQCRHNLSTLLPISTASSSSRIQTMSATARKPTDICSANVRSHAYYLILLLSLTSLQTTSSQPKTTPSTSWTK